MLAGAATLTICSVLLRDALADPVYGPIGACIGSGSVTGSCSSTSSRTPTRCSGKSCARPFTAAVTLVLVGDPKQAIYAFRGADVMTYLDAVEPPAAAAELEVNRRSDAGSAARAGPALRRCGAGPRRDRRAPGASRHQEESRIPGARRRCGCGI